MSRQNRIKISKGKKKYIRRLKQEYKQNPQPEIVKKIEDAYTRHYTKHPED